MAVLVVFILIAYFGLAVAVGKYLDHLNRRDHR